MPSPSSNSFCRFLSFSLFFLLLQTTTTIVHGDDPLSLVCSNNSYDSLPPNDITQAYKKDVRTLLARLHDKAPRTGFFQASVGRVHGLALCRGDIRSNECKYCLGNATQYLKKHCSSSAGTVVIWYDMCELKYSPKNFSGEIDTKNLFNMTNTFKLTNDSGFAKATTKFLYDLSEIAVRNANKLYAAGEEELCWSLTLRGLVQCTRDLSAAECGACLRDAIGRLPTLFQGARVVGGSCSVRTEIYAFFNSFYTSSK